MSQVYQIHVSAVDLSVALDCEADRARSEEMFGTAERQARTARHVKNASRQLSRIVPDGYRLQCTIQFEFVPDVNPQLTDEAWERMTRP